MPRQVRLCPLSQLKPGRPTVFDVAGLELAVLRQEEGGLYAIDNRCPHRGGPLADGMVIDGKLTCPLHGRGYCLRSGACDRADEPAAATYPVCVEHGWVLVTLP